MGKRTTLTLDDALERQLRKMAAQRNVSLKALTNDALRQGLAVMAEGGAARPYRLEPTSMGRPADGIDLDKANHLANDLEDAALIEKLRAGK